MKGIVGLIIVTLLMLSIFIAAGTGYVKNVSKFIDCDFEAPYKCEIVHGVGLVPVVGMITGYMDIED